MKSLKKMVITSCFFLIALLACFEIVNADTYSQIKRSNVSAGGARYSISDDAMFHTVGNTRWTYEKGLKYLGGTMYPINAYTTVTLGKQFTTGTIHRTQRNHKLTVTNQSYIDYYANCNFVWDFDTSINRFIE